MVLPASEGIPPVPPYSGSHYVPHLYVYGTLTPCGVPSQVLRLQQVSNKWSYNPGRAVTPPVWALPPSLATTRGITACFLFLRVLRCFSSPRWLTLRCNVASLHWVAPFGHPRIKACVRLPVAFRRLPRPSSPARAQASPRRPSLTWPPRPPRQSMSRLSLNSLTTGLPRRSVVSSTSKNSSKPNAYLWRITDSNR